MTDDYNKLVQTVELKEIALLDLTHHREPNLRPPLRISHKFDVRLDLFSERELVARAEFSLEAFPQDEQEKGSVELSIKLAYRLVYSVAPGDGLKVDERLAHQFLERNVPINIWPYIRETVTTLTAKMGLAPLVLPTLKITR